MVDELSSRLGRHSGDGDAGLAEVAQCSTGVVHVEPTSTLHLCVFTMVLSSSSDPLHETKIPSPQFFVT